MMNFLLPYIQFLYGAAFNIQQTLEGYGLASSNFIEHDSAGHITGSYWSPPQAAVFPFVILLMYSFFLLINLLLSGFILGKWKGFLISLLAIISPGILNLVGFWPQINYLPDSFVIGGTGKLGSELGFIPLPTLGFISGWTLVIIMYDTFKFNEKFRHYYDHFWYCAAILAGVFFVSDSGAIGNLKDLQEENQISRQASLYLLDQVRNYDSFCQNQEIGSKLSCKWASEVQQLLNDYATYDERQFSTSGPKSSNDVYKPLWSKIPVHKILEIRKEIKLYNDLKCPVESMGGNVTKNTSSSGECQQVPFAFCSSFPDKPIGLVDKYILLQTVALASECIVPSLVVSRRHQEKLILIAENNSKKKHQRWLFFALFSIVIGGKVANATTKAAELDKRPEYDRQRLIKLIVRLSDSVNAVFVRLLRTISTTLRRLHNP